MHLNIVLCVSSYDSPRYFGHATNTTSGSDGGPYPHLHLLGDAAAAHPLSPSSLVPILCKPHVARPFYNSLRQYITCGHEASRAGAFDAMCAHANIAGTIAHWLHSSCCPDIILVIYFLI